MYSYNKASLTLTTRLFGSEKMQPYLEDWLHYTQVMSSFSEFK